MCASGRCSGPPQSRSGLVLSRHVLFGRASPGAVVERTFARERDSVCDAWNCDAAAEAADQLRLQRVVGRLAGRAPRCAMLLVAEDAERPQRGVRRRRSSTHSQAIVDAVAVGVAGQHLVDVDVRPQQVVAVVGDVADFERGFRPDLVLEHQVPLPVVRRLHVDFASARRRAERRAEAAVARLRGGVERSRMPTGRDERRVGGRCSSRRQALAQEELADAGAQAPSCRCRGRPRRRRRAARSCCCPAVISERFGPSVPPCASAPDTSSCPAACSRPLHGSLPSAGLNSAGHEARDLVVGPRTGC